MKRFYATIGMVLVIALLPAMAQAQAGSGKGGRGDGPRGPGRMHQAGPGIMQRQGWDEGAGAEMILRMKEKLNLSDEQVTQLEAIKEEAQGQFKTVNQAVRAKREALHTAATSGAGEAAIRTAATELGKAIGDQAVYGAVIKTKVDAVLTDAQKAQLKEMRQKRMERGEARQAQGEQAMGKGKGQKAGRGPGQGPGPGQGLGQGPGPEAAFKRMDADGNGVISMEEFKTHMEQMRERWGGQEPNGRRTPRGGRSDN